MDWRQLASQQPAPRCVGGRPENRRHAHPRAARHAGHRALAVDGATDRPRRLSRFLHYRPVGGAEAPLPPSLAGACGLPSLHWVVVGGETGAKSRPMQLEWARNLRDQCTSASVPFFFKQWGDWVPTSQRPEAHGWDAVDRDVPRRMGKKRAGRLLDDRTWDEFPTDPAAVAA
ncbi:DUF5131 family protein [Salinispora arenicola]|nr:DUF5131 family protein [Salinispora arenicola]NIL62726.1 DUF5131 family protein [Salinispora arenicola]